MNIKQVGQFAAVSTLAGLATRYVLNRFLSNQTSEKTRNIASLIIGLGCGLATRNCSIKTLASSLVVAGGNLLRLLPPSKDQIAYAELNKEDAKANKFSFSKM